MHQGVDPAGEENGGDGTQADPQDPMGKQQTQGERDRYAHQIDEVFPHAHVPPDLPAHGVGQAVRRIGHDVHGQGEAGPQPRDENGDEQNEDPEPQGVKQGEKHIPALDEQAGHQAAEDLKILEGRKILPQEDLLQQDQQQIVNEGGEPQRQRRQLGDTVGISFISSAASL